MKKKLRNNTFLFLLILIGLFLFVVNSKQDTYLIGWDNEMPEFNSILNIKRSLFSVWQEYRGLGLHDGMAHAANLIHSILAGLLTLFLPQNRIRYAIIIFLHTFGGIGMYYVINLLIRKKAIAFIGALFYMFNIGIIQQFYAPFEVFAFHFAFLPWILWAGLKCVLENRKRNTLLFFIISFSSTPQGFVPTVFIASLSIFITLLLIDFFTHRNIYKFIVVFAIYLAVNSFWLIPYMHGAPSTAKIILNARINKYSSETLFLRNKQYGSILKVFSLDGFMLHLTEYDGKAGQNVNLMGNWEQYSQTPFYRGIYIGILCFGLIGVFSSIKNIRRLSFLAPLLGALFFLANDTPIIRELNQILRNISPTLGEAFRIPFTKWITVFTFSLAIFISFGIDFIVVKVTNYTGKRAIYLILVMSILILGLPALKGDFFSNLFRRELPKEYLNVMTYFDSVEKNKRIALLPVHTYWSWQYRTWGHLGSGFLWYGIQQPIMERAFDPWSNLNEQFYNELSFAINNEDNILFTSILKKYNIDYLLIDQYLFATLWAKPINYESLIGFLDQQSSITFEKSFGEIMIYKVNSPSHSKFLYSLSNPTCTSDSFHNKYYSDNLYVEKSDYIQCRGREQYTSYPFMNLFTEVGGNNLTVYDAEKYIIFKSPVLNTSDESFETSLILPSITESFLIPTSFEFSEKKLTIHFLSPKILIDSNEIENINQSVVINTKISEVESLIHIEKGRRFLPGDIILIEKDNPNTIKLVNKTEEEIISLELYTYKFSPSIIPITIKPDAHIQIEVQKLSSDYQIASNFENGIVVNENEPLALENIKMPHREGYVGFIESVWEQGLPYTLSIENKYKRRPQMEMISDKKNTFYSIIIPPSNDPYSGYTAKIDKTKLPHLSKINGIKIYPIPYEFISHIRINGSYKISSKEIDEDSKSNEYFQYEADLNEKINSTYVLSQSFDHGWKAYMMETKNGELSWLQSNVPFFFGTEIKDHVLVNNWSNGWTLDNSKLKSENQKIVIIFYPQYLQFIGFAILFLTFGGILLWKRKKKIG